MNNEEKKEHIDRRISSVKRKLEVEQYNVELDEGMGKDTSIRKKLVTKYQEELEFLKSKKENL